MRKRHYAAAFFILAAIVAVLTWSHSEEPTYQAKPLSYWMLRNARPRAPDQPDPALAIAAIGSNAVPHLIKWAEQRPYDWQKRLRPYRDRSPFLRRYIPFWATGIDKQNRALTALKAMQCLGPAGRSAVPRLLVLANNTNSAVAALATTALCKIDALPALLTLATNPQAKARWEAIDYLGNSKSAAALPTLLRCLDDPDGSVSAAAARALGTINQNPTSVVPALVRALRRAPNTHAWNQPDRRSSTVWALAGFGTNADIAVPELVFHLSKANQNDPICYQLMSTVCCVSAQPDAIVPALTVCLQSTNATLREYAVSSVGAFGPRGQSFLISLTNALQFPDTRAAVMNAIRRISSELPTNTLRQ